MAADRSGEFMLAVWDWDPNAHLVHGKGFSLRASIPRNQVVAFRKFLVERGWEIVGQQGAPGGSRVFCKAVPSEEDAKDGEG